MQTVSFHCGQCGQLMAVGTEHLGQPVRCPHCAQVVTAPAANPETPAASEPDSIFGTPDAVGEDLFGMVPTPTVEMPAAAPWLSEQGQKEQRSSAPTNGPVTVVPASEPAPPTQNAEEAPALTDFAPSVSERLHLDATAHASNRANVGLLLLLIFLIPYAVCATAAAVYFYFQKINTPHPLEALPDYFGDKPGATHKKAHVDDIIWERPSPDMDLPPRDHVALHQSLKIGDLEVTPEKVERGRITIFRHLVNGRETIPLQQGLLLTLRVRNISQDDYFRPADGYFYRRWQTNDPPASKPYTRLQIGNQRFYGGPVRWTPLSNHDPRYFVEGQENFTEELAPGQTQQLVICTDPENPAILQAAKQATDKCEWRVQLRRGLMAFKGREIPTSAVVAVDFSAQDIQ